MTSQAKIEQDVRSLAEPIAESMELYVYDVEVVSGKGSGMVRVMLERSADADRDEHVTVDELTRASRELGYILDVEDPIPHAYRLEVSSPGVERKLRLDEHFRAACGEEVRVILRKPTADERSVLEGRLLAADEDMEWGVEDSDGVVRRFPVRHVKKAHTTFDFERAKQRKNKK